MDGWRIAEGDFKSTTRVSECSFSLSLSVCSAQAAVKEEEEEEERERETRIGGKGDRLPLVVRSLIHTN